MSHSKVHSESGYSLLSLLAGISIVSFLMMNLSALMGQGIKGGRTVSSTYEMTHFLQEIREHLSDSANCIQTFRPMGIRRAGRTEVTDIRDAVGNPVFSIGDKVGNEQIDLLSMSLGAYPFDPSVIGQGTTDFQLSLDKRGEVYGLKTYSRSISISFWLDGAGNILTCHAVNGQTNFAQALVNSSNCREDASPCSPSEYQVLTKTKYTCLYETPGSYYRNGLAASTGATSSSHAQAFESNVPCPGAVVNFPPPAFNNIPDGRGVIFTQYQIGVPLPSLPTGYTNEPSPPTLFNAGVILTQSRHTLHVCCPIP